MISGGITATAVIDGENGDNGYSSAVVQLYRRYAPTQVAPTPALPTGTLIYTFATGVLSGATASFNGWSQQIPAASADTKLFVTQATAISQDATDEISVNDWSTPVEYVKDGTKGDNGEAAVNVIVTPASLIVNQSLDNPSNLDSLSEQILFQVEKGSTPLNVTKIDSIVVEKDGNRNKISVTGSNSNYATLTAILKDADTNGKYYDQAYFTCRVAYTDGGTTKYVTGVKVKVYANLLGSWSEEVKGDTKNEVARSLSYAYIQDGQGVQTLEQIGTYTKSSTENISVLTKKVDNGKNLFSGVLTGEGWRSESSDTFPTHQIVPVTVDDDGYMVSNVTNPHVSSPLITLDKGVDYAFSFEGESTGSATVYIFDPAHYQDQPATVVTTTGTRKTATFKIAGTGTISVYVNTYIGKLRYPQLEVGTTATAFVSGDAEITSRIKQMADEIELLVQDTGVDITHGKINLYADKVKFYKNKASATAGDPAKIWIDGSKGTLHAVDGEFEGTVKATNFFHNAILCGEETKAYCGASFFTYYSAEPWVSNFTLGGYYTKAEVQQLSNGYLGDFGDGMTKCTFDADIIILPHGSSDTGDASINLPMATDFDGKLVEIVDTRYTQSYANPVGALTVSQCDGASKMRGNFGATPAQYVRLNGNNSHDGGNYRLLSYEGYWVKLSTVSNA